MKLYLKYLSILFKSQLEYKVSFILLCCVQFFMPFVSFATIFILFQKFPHIGGWSLHEVLLCFCVIHMSSAIAECFARGFDLFSSIIVNGEFDRVLVRPRGTIIQVLGSKFEFSRVGRLLQNVILLVYAINNLSVTWDIYNIITLILMIVSGVFIFSGIYMLGATMSFWTIECLEITNIFTNGGKAIAQYPLSIYRKPIRKFFTYIIPFATVNYLPLMSVLGRVDGNKMSYLFIPVLGTLFIIPCILVWNLGVKHYKSSGS
ncbi:ABC-2 family transporter protein [Clostridiaceae bacterium M8S5]|nr:ABC-2 family transporter protein [Clostridiaceae bacterium M8S5]